jgi:putative transposase
MPTNNRRKPYPTDLSDEEWGQIARLLSAVPRSGRRPRVDKREIVNALLYWGRTNCPWRMLPHDLPAWSTVYYYYCCWLKNGTLERLSIALRRPGLNWLGGNVANGHLRVP